MKNITGKYHVADCEHNGDMESAKSFIRSLGCIISDSYWDGRDCGEAWVEFSFPENRFVAIYNKLLGYSVYYNADINDYINEPDSLPYKRIKGNELLAWKNKMAEDCESGFEERLPLWLFFEINGYCQYTPAEIISKVLSFFEEPVEVLGYDIHIVDGNKFCDVLLKSSYRNLSCKTMQYGIGDYCLGDRGFLDSIHVYGECRCVHKWINTSRLRDYEYLHRVINCMKSGLPIEYRNQDNYYHPIDIILSSDKYMDSDGSFKAVIEIDGKKYSLKDPCYWEWKKPEYHQVIIDSKKGYGLK